MNKALKIVMYAAIGLIILIFLLISFLFIGSFLSEWPQNYQCWQGNGTWTGFPTDCQDECDYPTNVRACADFATLGCECGPEKCWNGNKCINNEEWLQP
jgi:hypothetical protein